MVGQYISPRKGPNHRNVQHVSELSRRPGGRMTKVSMRQQRRTTIKHNAMSLDLVTKAIEMMENRPNPEEPDFMFDSGNWDGGFGDDSFSYSIPSNHSGTEGRDEDADWFDDESLETTRPSELPDANELFARGGVCRRLEPLPRSYQDSSKLKKQGWDVFVSCVSRDLAFSDLKKPGGTCDCSETIKEIPAISFQGISRFLI